MTENKTIYYQNGTFSVEDNLFYENNIRIGYFEEEEKEEILENNHKAIVDRLTNLRDSNIDLKRSNKKLRKENKELKQFKDKVFALIDTRIEIYKHKPFMAPVSAPMSVNFDEDTDRLTRLSELEQLKEELSE